MNSESPNRPTIYFKDKRLSGRNRGIRLWPAIVILILTGLFMGWSWFFRDVQTQTKVMSVIGAGMLGILLLAIWWLFFSRLSWAIRLSFFGGVLVLGLMASFVIKVSGFTGDLVPIVEWRWSWPVHSVAVEGKGSTNTVPSSVAENGYELGEFPQFLGPNRNPQMGDTVHLNTDWETRPPSLLWRIAVGQGWSGFAVSGTNAVTLEQAGYDELIKNYDLLSGNSIWDYAVVARYESLIGGTGPRTTPTIVSNRVYALGAMGDLVCLGLEDGSPIWQVNILADNQTRPEPDWGVAGSPLVVNGNVVVMAGGTNDSPTLVAYDAETGEKRWAAGTERMSYSSPVLLELAGQEQILSFNHGSLTGHDPGTGSILWKYPWGHGNPHVAVPVRCSPDSILVSSGYGVGAERLRIISKDDGSFQAEPLWKSRRLKAKFNNFVCLDGYVYGLDDGILSCLDLEDGRLMWKEGRFGHGQFVVVGDSMIITGETGTVFMTEPTPEGLRELGSFEAFDHKLWNPPALAGQLLLLRTAQEAACFVLPLADRSKALSIPESDGNGIVE